MNTRTVANPEITPDAMRAYRAAKALHRDGGTPASVFELLASIVEDRTWERLRDAEGEPFRSFTAFVEAAEPEGLGSTADELRKLLKLRHPHESGGEWRERAPWLRAEVDRLLGEDTREAAPEEGAAGPGRGHKTLSGTQGFAPQEKRDAAATVARLKRDDPELAERVVKGEVTPNAAALAKGWRKPRVILTSPQAVAQKIREHFTPDQIAQLVKLLITEET